MAFLVPSDFDNFADIPGAKATEMIEDATGLAMLVAPCLAVEDDLTGNQLAAIKAVLRGAILRWHDSGNGAVQSENIGTYGYTLDTRQQRRGMFWPSEIQQLQKICGSSDTSGIFAVDTIGSSIVHAEICATNFGAIYCSCGADLTLSYPLYELP